MTGYVMRPFTHRSLWVCCVRRISFFKIFVLVYSGVKFHLFRRVRVWSRVPGIEPRKFWARGLGLHVLEMRLHVQEFEEF